MNPDLSPVFATPCPPLVLCFDLADPTGAGGLQSDVLTLASLGAHALSVTTALTVQDTSAASALLPIEAEWVDDQARALLEDCRITAIKVGLLASVEAVYAVASIASDYDEVPLVLHPSPLHLLDGESAEEIAAAICEVLLPQTTLLVLDVQEADLLFGDDEDAADEPVAESGATGRLARRILETGCAAVLLLGAGEAGSDRIDVLFDAEGMQLTWPQAHLPAACLGGAQTLAAAAAGGLAAGESLVEAVSGAEDYTRSALRSGFRPGMGRPLPDRLFWARRGDAGAGHAH